MASLLFSRVHPCSPDLRPDFNTSSIKGFSREKVIVFDLGNLGHGKDMKDKELNAHVGKGIYMKGQAMTKNNNCPPTGWKT